MLLLAVGPYDPSNQAVNMMFNIVPYVSVGPLRWGMSPTDVAQAIGAPTQASKKNKGGLFEFREPAMVSCTYEASTKRLVEVGFSRMIGVAIFDGVDLNAGPGKKVLADLIRRDPKAVRGSGAFVFPALGISLFGYFPEEPDTKAATAFAPGRWDDMIPLMKERLPRV